MSVRQTGLLCPLLHPRRWVGYSRAPSHRHWWTLCACRRWLRGAPPFLRAVSVGFARASLLPRSRISLHSVLSSAPLVCARSPQVVSLVSAPGICIKIYMSKFTLVTLRDSRYIPERILMRHIQSLQESIRFTIERRWKGAGVLRWAGRKGALEPLTDRQVREGGVSYLLANQTAKLAGWTNKSTNGNTLNYGCH